MLRIVGGEYSGRRIQTPKGSLTRPTTEKVRESCFSILENLIALEGLRVLDLFSGSGALGIEALSRGAGQVVFVEFHHRTAQGIKENLRSLGMPTDRWRVITSKTETWLTKNKKETFDLVLLDPPYGDESGASAIKALGALPLVKPEGWIIMEASTKLDLPTPPGLEIIQIRRYGDSQLIFFKKK